MEAKRAHGPRRGTMDHDVHIRVAEPDDGTFAHPPIGRAEIARAVDPPSRLQPPFVRGRLGVGALDDVVPATPRVGNKAKYRVLKKARS